MILANFSSWKPTYIIITLILFTLFFATLMPRTQEDKNRALLKAVLENNVTKAHHELADGAQKEALLPAGFPLISLAIEKENVEMAKLLMLEPKALVATYKGYKIMEHVIEKKNAKMLQLFVDALNRSRNIKEK